MATFQERLNEALEEKCWRKLGEFCKKAGICYNTLRAYRKGWASPTLPVFLALADALGVSLDWLSGRE